MPFGGMIVVGIALAAVVLILAAGLSTLFIGGDVITYNYPKFFHHDIPFPSIGDVFYLCVYPCLIAGILLLIRRRTPGRDRDSLIDSLIVTVGFGLLSWEFLIAPYARDYTLSLPVKLVSMAWIHDALVSLACATICLRILHNSK